MYPAKPPESSCTASELPTEIDFFLIATHKGMKSSELWISTGKNTLALITKFCKVTHQLDQPTLIFSFNIHTNNAG